MQYAIAKLHFRDPPSPESLGEGLGADHFLIL